MNSNSSKAQPGWPAVVVAGAFQTGVVLMRNLAHRGLAVFCIDCNLEQPGFRSIYGTAFGCPNPDEAPSEWLIFMIDLARKLGGRPVLIPSADQFVSAIAEHAAELDKFFVFCHAAMAVQSLLATKRRQYDLANEHGLPVSRTQFVTSLEELTEFGSSARFPCLLKPLHVREWGQVPPGHPLESEKVVVADSLDELITKYLLVAQINAAVVVQEVIEGPDTAKLVYMACYSQSGERIGACVVRQIRTMPIYFGSASVVEPVSDPEIDSLCDGFLQSIGYAGLCEIEVKRDSRDGKVKMIEANPRYSVTADAAPYAGVDLGWLHYLDLIGEHVEMVEWSGNNFRHIVLFRDFATIRSYFRAGLLTWGSLLRSYRPPVVFFDFDIRDWRLTLATLITLTKLIIGPPLRKVFPKRRRASA